MMRWGMQPPPRIGGPPVINIRNPSSPHWRGWLKPENHCLVPFNSFAEYAPVSCPHRGYNPNIRFAAQNEFYMLPTTQKRDRISIGWGIYYEIHTRNIRFLCFR
jgi:putative SOS response-associated peptidase YedK